MSRIYEDPQYCTCDYPDPDGDVCDTCRGQLRSTRKRQAHKDIMVCTANYLEGLLERAVDPHLHEGLLTAIAELRMAVIPGKGRSRE